jgi:hypothetical protein
MSAVMTPKQLKAAFDKWKVPYIEIDGWQNRGRPESLGWGNMHGIANHHTATPKSLSASDTDSLLVRGRSDLPGPLAQFGVRRGGKVSIIALGRANHAGAVRREVLEDFLADRVVERPTSTLNETIDANAFLYGFEVHNNGVGEDYPDEQLRALVLANAAICDFHGWSHNASAQHRTITARKVDMAPIRGQGSDPWLRGEVKYALKVGPGKYALPWEDRSFQDVDPVTPLVTPSEDSMTLIVHPNGSAYHLTSAGLVWLPADVRNSITGAVTVVTCDQETWDRYREVYPG